MKNLMIKMSLFLFGICLSGCSGSSSSYDPPSQQDHSDVHQTQSSSDEESQEMSQDYDERDEPRADSSSQTSEEEY